MSTRAPASAFLLFSLLSDLRSRWTERESWLTQSNGRLFSIGYCSGCFHSDEHTRTRFGILAVLLALRSEVQVDGKGVVADAVKRPFILYRLLLGLLPF